jgi:two-component system phosphate regulon sensor histidine kinase PhoR
MTQPLSETVLQNYRRYRHAPWFQKKEHYLRLLRATGFLSLIPMTMFVVLLIFERITLAEGFLGALVISIGLGICIRPYVADGWALMRYVDQLSIDRPAPPPPLSRLGNIKALSDAVIKLHHSWEGRRVSLESALTESRVLFDILPDILMVVDTRRRIIRANHAAFKRLGRNLVMEKISRIHNDAQLEIMIEEALTSGKSSTLDIHHHGYDYELRVARFPIQTNHGATVVVNMHDMTETRRIKQLIKDFVANASHEIRTPLTSVSGFLEILQTLPDDQKEQRQEFIDLSLGQTHRIATLVSELLNLSKIEMQEDEAPSESVDLCAVVKRVKKSLDWQIKEHKVKIVISAQENMPKASADPAQIEQVITNLLSNAIKYGNNDSTITIELGSTYEADDFGHAPKAPHPALYVSFSNKGEPLDPADIPRLTERFYRVDKARSAKVEGTGLGLSIVKHILDRHHGALAIKSLPRKGNQFTILLPIPSVKEDG